MNSPELDFPTLKVSNNFCSPGLVPVPDPLTPLGYVDQLSLLFGLHEQSHVVIVNPHTWSSDIHVYTFQKRLKDGAFYMVRETKETVGGGLLDSITAEGVDKKCNEILEACER